MAGGKSGLILTIGWWFLEASVCKFAYQVCLEVRALKVFPGKKYSPELLCPAENTIGCCSLKKTTYTSKLLVVIMDKIQPLDLQLDMLSIYLLVTITLVWPWCTVDNKGTVWRSFHCCTSMLPLQTYCVTPHSAFLSKLHACLQFNCLCAQFQPGKSQSRKGWLPELGSVKVLHEDYAF